MLGFGSPSRRVLLDDMSSPRCSPICPSAGSPMVGHCFDSVWNVESTVLGPQSSPMDKLSRQPDAKDSERPPWMPPRPHTCLGQYAQAVAKPWAAEEDSQPTRPPRPKSSTATYRRGYALAAGRPDAASSSKLNGHVPETQPSATGREEAAENSSCSASCMPSPPKGTLPVNSRRYHSKTPRTPPSNIVTPYTKAREGETMHNGKLPKFDLDTIARWFRAIDRPGRGVVGRQQLLFAVNEDPALFEMFCAFDLHLMRLQRIGEVEEELSEAVRREEVLTASEATDRPGQDHTVVVDELCPSNNDVGNSVGHRGQLKWAPNLRWNLSTQLRTVMLRRSMELLGIVAGGMIAKRGGRTQAPRDRKTTKYLESVLPEELLRPSARSATLTLQPETAVMERSLVSRTNHKRLLDYEIAVEFFRVQDMVLDYKTDANRNDVALASSRVRSDVCNMQFRLRGQRLWRQKQGSEASESSVDAPDSLQRRESVLDSNSSANGGGEEGL